MDGPAPAGTELTPEACETCDTLYAYVAKRGSLRVRAVSCPKCGRYPERMVLSLRRSYAPVARVVGWIALVAGAGWGLLAGFAPASWAATIFGATLIAARTVAALRWDPNADAGARAGQERDDVRILTREQWEKLDALANSV